MFFKQKLPKDPLDYWLHFESVCIKHGLIETKMLFEMYFFRRVITRKEIKYLKKNKKDAVNRLKYLGFEQGLYSRDVELSKTFDRVRGLYDARLVCINKIIEETKTFKKKKRLSVYE